MNDEDICTEFPTELWSTLSDVFRKSVTEKIEGGTPTFTLVALAERNIACLEKGFSSGAIERDIYKLSTVHEDIRPEAVLGAMLAHATDDDTCTAPRRYVACSIVTAAAQDEQLIELANVWVRYLFWPFKANGCHYRDPSINETRISASRSHFEDSLRKRDGNRCVVTRVSDFSAKSAHVVTVTKPAHILKKVGVTGKRGEKLSSEHATWNILRRFAALSEEEVAELDASIDSIRNGLTLNMSSFIFRQLLLDVTP
ncbi:hypothetical protein ARMSODRAFT_1051984 [Armillaria solidipes]|uniref:HNH nuclease domain-containing protein n=1 Tax=Armillaria solidipes TaxID=1076256 RepID=A0A2H3BHR8_9AGAR|nr:hypothetical protein ARMSODRAFT_1051984 [Armillaria solidipes]